MQYPIASYYSSVWKRFFDLTLSAALLVCLSPVFILLILAVGLTMGRPLFFLQKRMGQYKKPFVMYKFRTMYVGAEKHQRRWQHQNQAPAPMFKISHDPRFVGIGRWLSETGLDELPQLIHILKGEMSLIGPRPLPVNEATKLNASWDFRYQVKPGVFSAWTFSSNRHQSLRAWKKLELETLAHGSWVEDLVTIWKTLFRDR